MSSFDEKFQGGEAYNKYKALESQLTPEFQNLTFELMVETYIRDQMNRKFLSDVEFGILKASWYLMKDRDLGEYPYNMEKFPQSHPMTRDAAIEGKKRLGIS